jgi:hypothetical protein
MIRLSLLIALSLACTTTRTAHAYKEETHETLSSMAFDASNLWLDAAYLAQLGLKGSGKDAFPGTTGERLSIAGLIVYGAHHEDDGARPLNHFFNPLNGAQIPAGPFTNYSSPDWVLEDKGDITSTLGFGPTQNYSFKDARQYLFDALTTSASGSDTAAAAARSLRDQKFGLLFETLGRVLHHLQDMSQPQHVRLDAHCDDDSCKWVGKYNPSLYETKTNEIRKKLPSTGFQPVFPNADTAAFTKPRDFWVTSGFRGIAEFTNLNFVSAGTNFDKPNLFSSPQRDSAKVTRMNIQDLCADPAQECPAGLSGYITFYGNDVRDNMTGQVARNPYASSLSLFSADLKKVGWSETYTLNRFNFQLAHTFLIPRAVAYSAGMLNFFFRGKLEISLPDEGVYGVIDHTIENVKDTSGFRSLRLKVKNLTPRGTGIEPMTAPGKLRAIAKFHRNTCYQPDLSGEFGAVGVDWKGCRTRLKDGPAVDAVGAVEEILVSDEVDVGADVNTATRATRTFNFPTPIPINATDLFLQVVYRGPLGEEADAVAVATKDISEPTFLYKFDAHDQVLYARYPSIASGPYTWEQWCNQAVADNVVNQAECADRLWPAKRAFQFSPTGAAVSGWDPAAPTVPMNQWIDFAQEPALNPVATLYTPVGSFARIAVLTDATPPHPVVLVDDWNSKNHTFAWVGSGFQPAKSQLDVDTKTLTPTQSWAPARGIYVSPSDAQLIGAPSNVGNLLPQTSTINFPSVPVSP